MIVLRLSVLLACLTAPASADLLPDMAGTWSGGGWARQTADGPQEAVRCRLENAWEEARSRPRMRGTCAVPGRRFAIDGALAMDADDAVRGFWSNPDGPGRTGNAGRIQGEAAYFTFSAKRPGTGEQIAQIITWRLDVGQLTLVSTDRLSDSIMARIDFAR